MELRWLVHLNAALNLTAAALLWLGRRAIRAGQRQRHRRLMLSAFAVSVAFLICYLVYHAAHGSVRFTHPGPIRVFYLVVLLTHVVLAALVPPLAGLALWLGLRGQDARHRRLVRWAWPIWMYVSVTGVVVYLMLYHLYPPA